MEASLPNKIRLACDASSLIILYKAGVLEKVGEACLLYTSVQVFAELGHTSRLDELVVYRKLVQSVPAEGNLCADDSLFRVYQLKSCDAILSDDAAVLKQCERNGVRYFSAASVLPFLHGENLLAHHIAVAKMEAVKRIGRYSPRVLAVADEMMAIACRRHR